MEQQEQDTPPGLPAPPMPVPLPEGPGEDFFKFRIDGSDILDDMAHQLRGEVFDEKANKYVVKFDRWVNDDGINKVLHVIYACGINKNTFLGNLTQEQILFKCRSIKKKLALLFFKKYKEFEIKKEMRDLLVTTVVNTVHSGLSRSEGGKESDQLSVAAQRIDHFQHIHQQEQQRRGLMGKLPFFGKGRN